LKHLLGKEICIWAPAKLNLCLCVEGLRADGYHLLSMLNAAVDLCDKISLKLIENPKIEVKVEIPSSKLVKGSPDLFDPNLNLAARAIQIFLSKYAPGWGAEISLSKHIPLGAGLGGGSSDAGCVLRALGDLFGVSRLELTKLALSLGADLPFFLGSGFSYLEGIGEELIDLDPQALEGLECMLILPKQHLSTKQVFKLYREQSFKGLPLKVDSHSSLKELALKGIKAAEVRALLKNDLESSALKLAPVLAQIAESSRQVAGIEVSMTGSGAAFFALPDEGLNFGAGVELNLVKALEKFDLSVVKTSFLPIPMAHVD